MAAIAGPLQRMSRRPRTTIALLALLLATLPAVTRGLGQAPTRGAEPATEARAQLERARRIREMILAERTAVMLGQVLEARGRRALLETETSPGGEPRR